MRVPLNEPRSSVVRPSRPGQPGQEATHSTALLSLGAILGTALLLLALTPPWLEWVVNLQTGPVGTPLDIPDVRVDYITGVFWALLLTAIVALWAGTTRIRGPLLIVWLTKVFVDLGPMLFYDYRYGVDTDGYFHNASLPGFEWEGLTLGAGTLNTRMLTWLHIQFLSSSFTATRLTFAAIGLLGVYLFYRAAVICVDREDQRIFYLFAFMPSVLFWSSILGKDPLTMFGVAAYTYGTLAVMKRGQPSGLLWVAIGTLIAGCIRIWLAPLMLLPLLVLAFLAPMRQSRRTGFIALALGGLLFAPVVVRLELQTDAVRLEDMLAKADRDARSFAEGGSTTREAPEFRSFSDLTGFAPLGMFTVLFRPLPGEVMNPWGVMAGGENIFLLLLAVRAALRSRWKDLRDPLVSWGLVLTLAWAFTYSVTAYQNLGTASRHKLEIMPVFFGLLLYAGRSRHAASPQSAVPMVTSRALPMHRAG